MKKEKNQKLIESNNENIINKKENMNKRKIFLILSITSLYTLWALSSIITKKNIPLTAVLSFPIMYVNIKLASNINNNIIEMNKFELDSYNKVTGNSSNLVNLKKSQTKNKK